MKKPQFLIGIDEVGRGPIAGPVAVGAFIFLHANAHKLFKGVKESKQLTEQKREEWFSIIERAKEDGHVNYCVTFQSEKVIDKQGLSFAIRKALETSLAALEVEAAESLVLLDGGLKAPPAYVNQKTIIKGDEKEKVIALASICAKVLRDRKMNRLAEKYSAYGFERNKGYGTRQHYEALNKFGMLEIHRRSFLKGFEFAQ